MPACNTNDSHRPIRGNINLIFPLVQASKRTHTYNASHRRTRINDQRTSGDQLAFRPQRHCHAESCCGVETRWPGWIDTSHTRVVRFQLAGSPSPEAARQLGTSCVMNSCVRPVHTQSSLPPARRRQHARTEVRVRAHHSTSTYIFIIGPFCLPGSVSSLDLEVQSTQSYTHALQQHASMKTELAHEFIYSNSINPSVCT